MSRSSRLCAAAAGCFAVLIAIPAQAQKRPEIHRLPLSPNGVIVEFHAPARAPGSPVRERFRRDLATMIYGKAAVATIRREYSVVFPGAALDGDPAVLRAIEALPYVKAIHPDLPVRALATGASLSQWGAMLRPATLATRGEGITVAVIDTGIDYAHPALGGGLGPGFKVSGGHDFVNDDEDPRDDHGHGTHVAGIIAADSEAMIGIAPGATLVAYKVLDASANGQQSDVIAALERAVDPNGDGDPTDHADVANLSLGGIGTPDDPQSLAVDAATAAGVIVCVAAGNEGSDPFSILSPGLARTAITVGAATEDGRVAPFSSRGPSVRLAAIKPDVLAPGTSVRSTAMGGSFLTKDGTSMAAPHVAGVCALIRALHAAWTPMQVKSAVTMTAGPIDAEVMTQGAGLLDVSAAVSAPLVASQSHFDFGLDAQQGGVWRRTQAIEVTNMTSTPSRYRVTAISGQEAIDVRATPALLELAPGATDTILVTITIDNTRAIANAAFLHGGSVTLASNGPSLHLPWGVVTSSRATLETEQAHGAFFVLADGIPRQPLWLSQNRAEVYAAAGEYEMVAVGYESQSGWPADVALVGATRDIAGDVLLSFTRADAPHRIVVRGTDPRGLPLSEGGTERYLARFHVHTPPLPCIRGLDLLTADGVLWTSDLHSGFTVKVGEVGADPASNRIVALQYPIVAGVFHDVILGTTPADLRRHPMRFVHSAGAAPRQMSLHSIVLGTASADDPLCSVVVASWPIAGAEWAGDLYANEENIAGQIMAVALQSSEHGHAPDVFTSALRVRDGRFIASSALQPSPLTYAAADGETITYGDGPVLVAAHVALSVPSLHACVRIVGAAGEARPRALESGEMTVYDDAGRVLLERRGDSVDTVLSTGDRAIVEFTTSTLSAAMHPMHATLSVVVDRTQDDTVPPRITSIAVVDGSARMTSTLRRGEAGALLFTVADAGADGANDPVVASETRAWFRAAGEGSWSPLAAVAIGEDGGLTATPLGVQYRAALDDAIAQRDVAIDLRIETADLAGNATTLVLEPAFTVVSVPTRRRAAGRR
jgi:subtilisin family serine protease